jgi:hypothetical protein
MPDNQTELDLAEARRVMAALQAVLEKYNPDRATGIAGALLLAARTVAVTATTQEEFDEILKGAHAVLEDSARSDFAARQRSAKRGRRTATTH